MRLSFPYDLIWNWSDKFFEKNINSLDRETILQAYLDYKYPETYKLVGKVDIAAGHYTIEVSKVDVFGKFLLELQKCS